MISQQTFDFADLGPNVEQITDAAELMPNGSLIVTDKNNHTQLVPAAFFGGAAATPPRLMWLPTPRAGSAPNIPPNQLELNQASGIAPYIPTVNDVIEIQLANGTRETWQWDGAAWILRRSVDASGNATSATLFTIPIIDAAAFDNPPSQVQWQTWYDANVPTADQSVGDGLLLEDTSVSVVRYDGAGGTPVWKLDSGSSTSNSTSSPTDVVTIAKAGHGLSVGDPVNYEIDLSDVVATNSDENEYNGVVSRVIDPNNVEISHTYGPAFTWTEHGLTEPYMFLGDAAQGGAWQTSASGNRPIIGLKVIGPDAVKPIAQPQGGSEAVPILVDTTAGMDTNARFYRLTVNDGEFNAGLYYRTNGVNVVLHEL